MAQAWLAPIENLHMSQMKTAQELNEQGIERFNQGDYAHAAALFEQAVQMATISQSVYLCNFGDAMHV